MKTQKIYTKLSRKHLMFIYRTLIRSYGRILLCQTKTYSVQTKVTLD